MQTARQTGSILAAFTACLVLLVFLFLQSQGLEGGQDSWMHFLVSRYALHYPELLLDQWNKPVFTWLTVLVCQAGIHALVIFNICCTLFSGLFTALAFRKTHRQVWVLLPLTVFCPILFGNTISGLTEPLNALLLSIVFFLWSNGFKKSSISVASLLPFVRTEGFVVCGAVFLFLLIRRQYRFLPYLLIGSLVLNTAGFAITGKLFWIITENPYWKFETTGSFDPGSGSLLHFVHQGRYMFGLLAELLLPASVLLLMYDRYRARTTADVWLLSILVFVLYFAAHSSIYYLGILGSHGLTRVMAVIAPCIAISVFFVLDRLKHISTFTQVKDYIMPLALLPYIWSAYGENDYAKPYRFSQASVKQEKAYINFIRAGLWLDSAGYGNRVAVHQSPFFNVRFNKDPYNPRSSYYIWSIDQSADWTEKGAIVIWDGFSALREGNLKLEWLQQNPDYKEIYYIEGFEKPENNPSMYDIHIFEKIQ